MTSYPVSGGHMRCLNSVLLCDSAEYTSIGLFSKIHIIKDAC